MLLFVSPSGFPCLVLVFLAPLALLALAQVCSYLCCQGEGGPQVYVGKHTPTQMQLPNGEIITQAENWLASRGLAIQSEEWHTCC